jgi:hypothetical protein
MSYKKQRLQYQTSNQNQDCRRSLAKLLLQVRCSKFIISVTFTIILVKKSKVHFTDKYVKIYDGGWLIAMCYIDYEDLFVKHMDNHLLQKEVESITLVNDEDFTNEIYRVDLK